MTIILVKVKKQCKISNSTWKSQKSKNPVEALCYKANDISESIESKFTLQPFAYTQTSYCCSLFI